MASECEKELIYLTYDLAIAKIALKVQATQSPQYENMFVNLGVVHMKMAFFSTRGCIVQQCNAKFEGPHLTSQE